MAETITDQQQIDDEGRRKKFEEKRREAERKRVLDTEKFGKWWNELSDERKKSYEELALFASDSRDNLQQHIQRCRDILELISNLKSDDNRQIRPIALAIHGTCPIVFIQAEGHEKPNGESKDEIIQLESWGTGERIFQSDIDTTEYGLPAKYKNPVVKYVIDIGEVNKRLEKMQ